MNIMTFHGLGPEAGMGVQSAEWSAASICWFRLTIHVNNNGFCHDNEDDDCGPIEPDILEKRC